MDVAGNTRSVAEARCEPADAGSGQDVDMVLLTDLVQLARPYRGADLAEMRFPEQQHLHA